jgi:hypothetical protein
LIDENKWLELMSFQEATCLTKVGFESHLDIVDVFSQCFDGGEYVEFGEIGRHLLCYNQAFDSF